MKKKTPLIIRVQAKGGMFLGPDSFGGAFITIENMHTKNIIKGFTNTGGSGTRTTTFQSASSPNPIITPTAPIPTFYWLTASPGTVMFSKTISLKKPAPFRISALIPLPPEQGDQHVSTTQWVLPDEGLSTGPGFILEIPGLWVRPEIISIGQLVRVRAKVTMMCGCEINHDSPWLPEDFEVEATIRSKGKSTSHFNQTYQLTFQENSQFIYDIDALKRGEYIAEIQAFQNSTRNSGFARKSFTID